MYRHPVDQQGRPDLLGLALEAGKKWQEVAPVREYSRSRDSFFALWGDILAGPGSLRAQTLKEELCQPYCVGPDMIGPIGWKRSLKVGVV